MGSSTVKALEIYKEELNKLKAKYIAKVEKEIEKHEKKIEQLKEEYPDIMSIDEAYGCGSITSSKRDKLYEIYNSHDDIKKYKSENGLIVKVLDENIKEIDSELYLISKEGIKDEI